MRLKTLVIGLLTGSILAASTPSLARDWDDDHRGRGHGYHRGGGHGDYIHDGRNYRRGDTKVKVYIDSYPHGKHYRKHRNKHWDDDSYYYNNNTYIINTPPVRYVPTVPVVSSGYRTVEVSCDRSPNVAATIIGGVGGGVLGNQFGKGRGRTAATIGGTLIGGLLGNSLTQNDRYCTTQVFEYAQPNTQVVWNGGGNNYSFQPSEPYQMNDGRYCREYQANATVGGRRQQTYGTACRQPDGDWEIIN